MKEDSPYENVYDQTSKNHSDYSLRQANQDLIDEPISNALYDSMILLDS